MRRSLRLLAPLMALLLLAGCALPPALANLLPADAAEYADGILVYRVAADPSDGSALLRAEPYPPTADVGEDPGTLVTLLQTRSGDASLTGPLPAGTAVESWSLENGVVTLILSDALLDAPEMDRSLAAFAAALTLCQLDGVDAVTVVCAGQTLYAGLMPEDAFLDDGPADPYSRQLRLYFPDAEGRYLVSEYHTLALDEDTSPERYVVEELLRGPNNGELRPVMPEGTRLLSCVTEDGVCTVNLSQAFLDARPDTALGERLVLSALANSLTALSGVDAVRVLVEGEAVDAYVYRSLAEPIERCEAAVGPVSAPKGELDADLWLAAPDLSGITPLPYRVPASDYDSDAEAVAAALLSAAEPGYPALFSGAGSVVGVAVEGTTCTVDLSESFFVSLPEEGRALAVGSLAASLCALPEIAAVRFTVGGDAAVFDGTDWSGPWRNSDEIEVP